MGDLQQPGGWAYEICGIGVREREGKEMGGGERASGMGAHGWRGPERVAELKRRSFS